MLRLKEQLKGWNLQWLKVFTFTHITEKGFIDTDGVEHIFKSIVPATEYIINKPSIKKAGLI